MNIRLNALSGALLLAFALLCGCSEDQPAIVTPPDPDTVKTETLPVGMPNWNDAQYDWLMGVRDLCQPYYIKREYWNPKFGVRVVDASPDGKLLLLSQPDRLAVYELATLTVRTIFPKFCEFAEWSRDGKHIAAVPWNEASIVIIDAASYDWHYLTLPDSTSGVWSIAQWLPGDTSIVAGLTFTPDGQVKTYAVNIHSSHISDYPDPHFNDYWGDKGLRIAGTDANGRFEVGPINSVDGWRSFTYAGIAEYVGGLRRVCPNGSRFAFIMKADLGNTRFAVGDEFKDRVTSLGIIDLKPGSSTQYQLYRVFPDYTNTFRNCSVGWFFARGAWSPDGHYFYHERVRREDSTMQIVRLDIETGKAEEISNFLSPP